MYIKSLSVEGFGPFVKKQVFKFKDNSFNIITGLNGAGKSTFFIDAIDWCLFGKLFKEMSVKDVVNEYSNRCIVRMKLDDGKVIERTRNKKTQTIKLNGKVVTQEKINRLTRIDRKIFFSSVIFGEGFGGFVYFKDKEKKDFVTSISLGFIDEYFERLKHLNNNISGAIEDYMFDIESINEKIEDINLIELNHKYKEYETINKNKIKILKKQLREVSNIVLNLMKETEAQKQLKKIDIKSIENKIELLIDKKKEVDGYIKRLEKEVYAAKQSKEKIIKHLQDLMDTSECYFCLQIISSKHNKKATKQLTKEIKEYNEDIEILEDKIKKLEDKYLKISKKIESLENKLESYKNKNEKRKEKKRKLNEDTNHYEKQSQKIREEISEFKDEENPFKDMLSKAKKKKSKHKEKIKIIKENLKDKSLRQEGVQFWDKKIRQFKSQIFKDILESFKPTANSYLRFISNNKYSLDMDTEVHETAKTIKDKFDIKVKNQFGKEIDFSRLSRGEKRQVSLSINLALIKMMHLYFASDYNFVIFDEIFDNFDNLVQDKVVELLNKLREETNKCIIMITHDDYRIKGMKNIKSYDVRMNSNNQSKIVEV